MVKRFEIRLVTLAPTKGSEISKTRPCVIVSPDEVHGFLQTVIVAPLTKAQKQYPTRVGCKFKGIKGQVALDQIRTIDLSRLTKKVGVLDAETAEEICQILQEMFAY